MRSMHRARHTLRRWRALWRLLRAPGRALHLMGRETGDYDLAREWRWFRFACLLMTLYTIECIVPRRGAV